MHTNTSNQIKIQTFALLITGASLLFLCVCGTSHENDAIDGCNGSSTGVAAAVAVAALRFVDPFAVFQ